MNVLTKQAIKRLNSSPIEVRLWNGCFNKATAIAKYSGNKYYELTVDVTHPELQWQCGNHNEVKLLLWINNNGYPCEIPEELHILVEKMKESATMQDAEARAISTENKQLFTQSMRELGII